MSTVMMDSNASLNSSNSNNMTDGEPSSSTFNDERPIFIPTATLYDDTVFHGVVLADEESQQDPKDVLRMRIVQFAVFCFSLIGIVLVAVSVMINQRADSDTSQHVIPTVQGWSPTGTGPIFGPVQEVLFYFGAAVALSGNGKTLAVAAPGTDQGKQKLNVGQVYIFTETLNDSGNVTEWELVETFPGPGPSVNPSSSLAMARNGKCIAVGYPKYQGGHVQVFDQSVDGTGSRTSGSREMFNEDTKWSLTGDLLPMTEDSDIDDDDFADPWFGYAIDLTPDGDYMAVGAPLTEPTRSGPQRGAVYFYHHNNKINTGKGRSKRKSSAWTRFSGRLLGKSHEQMFGWSLSLCKPPSNQTNNNNVLRVAVGGPASNVDAGVVRVHDLDLNNDNSSWRPIGQTLVGSDSLMRFGESVALSDDGSVLAVGARGSAFDPGLVQVFRLTRSHNATTSDDAQWIPDVQTFRGNHGGEGFGATVSLSADGNTLSIGGPGSREFAGADSNAIGSIHVYKYDSQAGEWMQQGSSLGGSDTAAFGAAMALSASGQRVVGGAPGTVFDGMVAEAGSVLIFDVDEQEVGP